MLESHEERLRIEGMVKATIDFAMRVDSSFLIYLEEIGKLEINEITPHDVTGYFTQESFSARKPEGVKSYAYKLKSFLMFLEDIGVITEKKLSLAVPKVFARQESIVTVISEKAEKALKNFKPETGAAVRDHVMILFALRLGVRRSDIVKNIGSKGCKDRIVYMSSDLTRLCMKYDAEMEMLLPGREYFFPSQHDKHFINTTICRTFNELLAKTSFYGKTSKKPTCHGFRHTFAVNSMRQCIANDDDFDGYIHYLSRYMGHKNPKETMYYLHMAVNIIPELREKAKGFEDVIGGVLYAEEE